MHRGFDRAVISSKSWEGGGGGDKAGAKLSKLSENDSEYFLGGGVQRKRRKKKCQIEMYSLMISGNTSGVRCCYESKE